MKKYIKYLKFCIKSNNINIMNLVKINKQIFKKILQILLSINYL